MSKQTKFIFFIIIIVIIVGGLGYFGVQTQAKKDSKLDGFAQCLSDSGAKFYGAFWCSHCNDQKEMFGKSAKLLPYVECSNKDGSQNEVCVSAKIEGYPTWVFADGFKQSGLMSFEELASSTKCELK